jgi:hypothetical protein
MTTTFVDCDQTTRINPGDKFRITFSQGSIEHWLAGGTMLSVYQSLSVSPWGYVVTEPPVDDAPVMVLDFRISSGTTGSAPPGTVADLLNAFQDQSFYNAYEVTRLEYLYNAYATARSSNQGTKTGSYVDAAGVPVDTSAPLEQRSTVIAQAIEDQKHSGVLGTVGDVVTKSFGSLNGLVIAAVIASVAIAVIVIVKLPRPATA